MEISVLTIGDELLSGEMADTNTARIAGILGSRGYAIRESLTVGDAEADIVEALLSLAGRRDVIIATGGLGPTEDDLTARAAARACKSRLAVHAEALQQVRDFFRRRNREMHPGNEKQALLPETATVLPNPLGTAPGFLLHFTGRDLFFLPGVPEEMEAILTASVLPRLMERGAPHPGTERILKIFGIPEPQVEEIVAGLPLPSGVRIAFGVDFPLVHLKLRASGAQAPAVLSEAERQVRERLGEAVVAAGEQTLAAAAARSLTEAQLKIALAESCTGGLVAKMLTDIPGASAFLERAAVTYANSAKSAWLDVPAAVLETQGAVSAECALAMARGIRRAAGSDVGLSITGIAGPDGGSPQKPVGTVFIALVAEGTQRVEAFRFHGERARVRLIAACTALDWLRRFALDPRRRPERV